MFRESVAVFSDACDRVQADPSQAWPSSLRVKSVRSAPGVFEMTWSFSGPDGRATWEWCTISSMENGVEVNRPAVRWRRVGNDAIFKKP